MQKLKAQKGITLIALVITIIVMLILVGVSVTVALNGGLFSTAKQATSKTQLELDKEQLLSAVIGAIDNNGKVDFGVLDNNLPEGFTKTEERTYTSKAGNTFIVSENGAITLVGETEGGSGGEDSGDNGETGVILPEGWTVAETKPEGWSNNVTAVTDGTNTIPLPKGFEISSGDGENTVTTGLVISDTNNNEFVWIPVTEDLGSSYSYSSSYSEPTELTGTYHYSSAAYDSQATLDSLYGTDYYNYEEDFNYVEEYAEMVASVNKYEGFYIGRYETTIDGTSIGSKENATLLTSDLTIDGTTYPYRWWGLYDAQRKANVVGNGDYIQTSMIWGQQWDAMLEFLGTEQANSRIEGTQSTVLKSAEAIYDNSAKDVMNNIYDLRRNALDWTAEAYDTNNRVGRGRLLQLHLFSIFPRQRLTLSVQRRLHLSVVV